MKAVILAVMAALIFATPATAATTKLWAPLNVASGLRITSNAPFTRLTGWPGQASGPHFFTYVKGSRTPNAHLPESWYVHQGGQRVRDKRFGYYVMNPSIHGWQQYVINECPKRCYLDGLGVTSISRTTPHLNWTPDQWTAAVEQELQAVVSTGIAVVPNSVGMSSLGYLDIAGRGSSEIFKPSDQSTWPIITAGHVWVDGHYGNCGRKLAAYLLLRGRGDLFHCATTKTTPNEIPASELRPPVGAALGPYTTTAQGFVRHFKHATLRVNLDGSYRLFR